MGQNFNPIHMVMLINDYDFVAAVHLAVNDDTGPRENEHMERQRPRTPRHLPSAGRPAGTSPGS